MCVALAMCSLVITSCKKEKPATGVAPVVDSVVMDTTSSTVPAASESSDTVVDK